MTQEEENLKKASIIKEFTGIGPYMLVSNITVLELYNLIKLAVNRSKCDL